MSLPTTTGAKVETAEVTVAPLAAPDTHPPAIWFFFWGEFAERCSYYGMRAILPLYITTLGFAANRAAQVYTGFKIACYMLPLLGGFLADRFFGRYWTIVGFSVPYVLGHFILGIPNEIALVIAMALLAGGSGVIKPNISTLMGQTYDQQRPGKEQLRTSAFLWFYFSINFGAVISQFTMPLIRTHYDYATAFQFPAWIMVISLIVFALGKPFYGKDNFERHELTPVERAERSRVLISLFGIFGLIVFWWVAYEQNDNLWIFFTRDYVDRTVPILGWKVEPDQLQFLNPLFVLILIPVFTSLFRIIDPQVRIFTAMNKILMGFVLMAVASGTMSAAGFLAQKPDGQSEIFRSTIANMSIACSPPAPLGGLGVPIRMIALNTPSALVPFSWVSVIWIAAAYIILTVGEVLLYGTALELAYAAAPKSMKGFITACFLLTNTLGNIINAWLSGYYGGSLPDPPDERGPILPGQFFLMSAGIALAAGFVFYFVGRRYEQQKRTAAAQAIT